ncbi:hypothetical protein AAKU67_001059 [Oxalobacteraceae bacterium GrIS 2.11]
MKFSALGYALFASVMTVAGHANAQYALTNLGQGTAYAVNDLGTVVGSTTSSTGFAQATEWHDSSITYLFGASNENVSAVSINDSNQVVGTAYDPGTKTSNALEWTGSNSPVALPSFAMSANANSINNAGQIAGTIFFYGVPQAVVWNGHAVTFLAPGAANSTANGINNQGTVAGAAAAGGVTWQSVGAGITNANDGNQFSSVTEVNSQGVAIGHSANGSYIFKNGLASAFNGNLTSINDNGLMTGSIAGTGAILYDGNTITNLNNYVTPSEKAAGWVLESASYISNAGYVVGSMNNTITGQSAAFELSPVSAVPEPGGYMMLLAGLGLLGFTRQRLGRAGFR